MALKKILSMSLVVLIVTHAHGVGSTAVDYDRSSSARLQDKLTCIACDRDMTTHRNEIEKEVGIIKNQSESNKFSIYQLDTLGVCLRENKRTPNLVVVQAATNILQRLFQSTAHTDLYQFGLNILTLLLRQGKDVDDQATQKDIITLGKLAYKQQQKYPHHRSSNKLAASAYSSQIEEFQKAMNQLENA